MPAPLARFTETPATEAATATAADLMEAMVAAYALMAHADGEVAPAERRRIFALLRDNPALSVFSRAEIGEEVAAHEANFRFDPEVAEQIAREKLAAVADRGRVVRLIVAGCRDLVSADGIAHPSEFRMLEEIKTLLGWTGAPAPRRAAPEALGRSW